MKKKLIALAIASAISAPAFADNANITFYGLVDLSLENVKTDNANGTSNNVVPSTLNTAGTNPASLIRVSSNASRFGVKGTQNLGEGLDAIYQYEVQVDANGNAGNGLGNGTRNSNVGLKGDFGTVFLGNWDTPFKLSHNKVELFDNTHFASATNLVGRSGATTALTAGGAPVLSSSNVTSAADNFNTRQKNVVQYWTPNFSGFEAKLAYGTDPAATDANASTTAPALQLNKTVLSVSASYDNEMFYVALAREQHSDIVSQTGTATIPALKGDNTANRVVAAYKFGDAGFVGVTYEMLDITTLATPAATTAAVVTAQRKNLEVVGSYKIDASKLGVSYVKAGDLGSYVNTGATQVSLRYGYSFSKRTEGYAMYSKISNKTYGQYNFSAGNVITGAAGANLTGFGLGVVHTF